MNPDIDKAATLGYESVKNEKNMPAWVAEDELLICAWFLGRRQATEKR